MKAPRYTFGINGNVDLESFHIDGLLPGCNDA
jgi:hypothetical protein